MRDAGTSLSVYLLSKSEFKRLVLLSRLFIAQEADLDRELKLGKT